VELRPEELSSSTPQFLNPFRSSQRQKDRGKVRGTATILASTDRDQKPSRFEKGQQIRVIRNRSTLDRLVLQLCLRFIRRSIP